MFPKIMVIFHAIPPHKLLVMVVEMGVREMNKEYEEYIFPAGSSWRSSFPAKVSKQLYWAAAMEEDVGC